MGLLPCLRRESHRWWLPCNDQAKDIIGCLLIAHAERTPIDDTLRQRLSQVFCHDPALMIFAALSFADVSASPNDELSSMISVDALADHFIDHLPSYFASGDSFVGAPSTLCEAQKKWCKLRDYFRTRPMENWMDEAELWLQVTGPSVPEDWKAQWPTLLFEHNGRDEANSPDCQRSFMLEHLARLSLQHRSLEAAFDEHLHSQKLDALKELAYGLSHEINNPLANISTRAQQLQRAEPDPSRNATLQRIVDQVYRAHEMIADLMFYANPPEATLETCQMSPVLCSIADSFAEELDRHSIRLEITSTHEEIEAEVDQKMIGEAIRVLLRNSIEAIGCQGTIIISMTKEGQQMQIHIADSGPGLSEEARIHAFDPYFSGREAGRGLGLGLCRAYRIARLHEGEITLAGGPAGCVATLSLPL
ncbi:MAG: HAMP domain-containing sensor histidine kinase [Planctomycetota bacterium]